MLRPGRLLALVIGLGLLSSMITVRQVAIAQVAEPTPLPLYYLPDATSNRAYSSGSMVTSPDGRMLIASNMLSNTIAAVLIVAPGQPQLLAEIPVGTDPRGVTVTQDNTL